jgi:ATP-binding cassette, subfamily C, bacterial CydCD
VVSPEVFVPFRRAAAEWHASAEGQAAARRLLDILATEAPRASFDQAPAEVPIRIGTIRADRVTLSHPGRSEPALAPCSFIVEPGTHLSVIGPSGSGKSTLFSLLLRFAQPTTGTLRIGETAIDSLDLAAWRRIVAWVPQRPHLVRGTLASNLRMGDPQAPRSLLCDAIEVVGLTEVVSQLPAGLETPVGEGGMSLSAGEQHRIALARALVRRPQVLLLDEPGSQLDNATERRLRRALAPHLEQVTVIEAAHRTQLLERVDAIVELSVAHHTAGSTNAQPQGFAP